MVREKPRINRRGVEIEEARQLRSVERLLRMTDLLSRGEALAEPVRVGTQIVVPIIPNRTPMLRYKDVVKSIASKISTE